MNALQERAVEQKAPATAPDCSPRHEAPAILAFLLSVVFYFLYVFLFHFSPLSRVKDGALGRFNQSGTVKYLFGIALLAVAFLALRVVCRKLPLQRLEHLCERPLSSKAKWSVFGATVLLLGAYLLVYAFYTETSGALFGANFERFPWRRLPAPLSVGLTGVLTLWLVAQIYRKRDFSRSAVYVAYFTAILLTYFSLLYINPYDLYHGVAYTESIYNVYGGAPFDLITTGIYGHYGIFYGLVLRIFRGNAEMMFHLIALVGAISTAACAYCIHRVSSKNLVRIIAILSAVVTVVALRDSNYWQIQPHRIVFPLLTAAYLCAMVHRDRYTKRRILLGYVLCTLAIVWNTESGLFCTLAYTLALIVHAWQSERWYAKHMWRTYLTLGAAALLSLGGAIAIVGLYNVICGGKFILGLFFFPLFEGSYMNGALKADLPWGAQVWILVLILFFLLLFYGLWHTRFLRDEEKDFDGIAPVAVALALLALTHFTYYANRSGYFNLDICCQFAAIAMALFADRFLECWQGIHTKSLSLSRLLCGVLSLFCVLCMTVLSTQIAFSGVTLAQREERHQWDVERLEANAAALAALVPEDYMLVGVGASVLNLQLERKAVHYYRDISDLNVGGTAVRDRIMADATAHGKVAFYLATHEDRVLMGDVLSAAPFVLVNSGMVGDVPVLCYERVAP